MKSKAEALRKLLTYDPVTGVFRWKISPSGNVKAGDIAGSTNEDFVYIRFEGKRHKAHRLAFLYMTGEMPAEHVDHIDGNPRNNSWGNLRECSRFENMQNRKVSKKKKSGFLGVSKHKSGWQATISKDKKYYYLGIFKTPEEAHKAYLDAKQKLHTFNPIPRKGSSRCNQN